AGQSVLSHKEKTRVKNHESDSAEAIAEPQRRNRNPCDASQHREKSEQGGQEAGDNRTDTHGATQQKTNQEREPRTNRNAQQASPNVLNKGAVLYSLKSSLDNRGEVRKQTRVDVEGRDQNRPADNEYCKG